MSNFHLQEIETLQNSLREREEYVTELENRLRALWDKYDGDRKHYMERIKRLEEAGDEIEMILLQYASRVELPKTMAAEQSNLSRRLCVNWREAKEDKL